VISDIAMSAACRNASTSCPLRERDHAAISSITFVGVSAELKWPDFYLAELHHTLVIGDAFVVLEA
jgi:hypothetical protein